MSQIIYKNYIAGKFQSSQNLFDDISPIDGSLVAKVAEASNSDVDKAVDAARNAFNGDWSNMPLKTRCDLLEKVALTIEKRFDDFVDAEVADTGKPVNQAKLIDIPRGAENFRFFSNYIKISKTESYEMQHEDG